MQISISKQNLYAIYLICFLKDAAIALLKLSSLSLLLTKLPAIYALYAMAVGSVIFSGFIVTTSLYKGRFSRLALYIVFFLSVIFFGCYNLDYSTKLNVFLIYTSYILSSLLMLWLMSELQLHFLNPTLAQEILPQCTAASSVSIIISVLAIKFIPELTMQYLFLIIGSLYFACAYVVFRVFDKKNNREFKYSEKLVEAELKGTWKVIRNYALITFLIGCTAFLVQLAFNSAVKHELNSYERINNIVGAFMIAVCIAELIGSTFLGKYVRNNHPSPTRLLQTTMLVVFVLSAISSYYLGLVIIFTMAIAAELNFSYSFTQFSYVSAFSLDDKSRANFRAIEGLCYLVLPYSILSAIFSYLPFMDDYVVAQEFTLAMIMISNLLCILMIFCYRRILLDYVSKYFNYLDTNLPILAANTYSFLKPKNFVEKLTSILHKKNISDELRKAAIISISYDKSPQTFKIITKDFGLQNEKTQMAIIESLGRYKNYETITFLIDIIEGKLAPKSTRTKMLCINLLAEIYGKNAIPIFLRDLKIHDNLRVKANLIEILAKFKDSSLISYFKSYISHENNRLRANCLMALSSFKDQSIFARAELLKMLKSKNPLYQASSLYVIGLSGDKYYYDIVRKYMKKADSSNPMIKLGIAWVMIKFHQQIGFEYLYDLFERDASKDKYYSHISYYSQMPEYLRLEVIDNLVRSPKITNLKVERFRAQLQESGLDFDTELHYLASFSA